MELRRSRQVHTLLHMFTHPCDPGISMALMHRLAGFRPQLTPHAAESYTRARTDAAAATVVPSHMQRFPPCVHMPDPELEYGTRNQIRTGTGSSSVSQFRRTSGPG